MLQTRVASLTTSDCILVVIAGVRNWSIPPASLHVSFGSAGLRLVVRRHTSTFLFRIRDCGYLIRRFHTHHHTHLFCLSSDWTGTATRPHLIFPYMLFGATKKKEGSFEGVFAFIVTSVRMGVNYSAVLLLRGEETGAKNESDQVLLVSNVILKCDGANGSDHLGYFRACLQRSSTACDKSRRIWACFVAWERKGIGGKHGNRTGLACCPRDCHRFQRKESYVTVE